MVNVLLGPPGLILFGAILGAIGALWASQQQASFERELREKNEEIVALNRRTLDSGYRGNSFPSLSVFLENGRSSGMLAIHHNGERNICKTILEARNRS